MRLLVLLASSVVLTGFFSGGSSPVMRKPGLLLREPRLQAPVGTNTPAPTSTSTPTSTRTPTPTATPELDFVVNSTGDGSDADTLDPDCETSTPGECTLKAAVQQHNIDAVPQIIGFAIAGGGPHEINPAASYGTTGDLTIDCGTQAGSVPGRVGASPVGGYQLPVYKIAIEAAGTGYGMIAAAPGGGLVIKGCEVRGFDAGGGAALDLDVDADKLLNSYVHGNAGTAVNCNEGINMLVRNSIISGNASGIGYGVTAHDNVVEDSYLGLAPDGTTGAGNTGTAIVIAGSDRVLMRRNVISANGTAVTIAADGGDDAEDNQVTDGLLGPDRTGSDAAGMCNFIADTGVDTVKTGNTFCTGCCAFTLPNGASATCIDTVLWNGFNPPGGLNSLADCTTVGGALGDTPEHFNGAVNCSTPGDLSTTCTAP